MGWVFRTTQWFDLVTNDLDLYVAQIAGYYGLKENLSWFSLDQVVYRQCLDANLQSRSPVTNHMNFCMSVTAINLTYGAHLEQPPRRYLTYKLTKYAFANLQS